MFATTARLARDAHRVVSRSGEYAVYMLSFSEVRQVKKDGQYSKEYTNYSASVMAKIGGAQDDFYGQMLIKGNVIGIHAENIYPESREHDGKTYLEIKLDNARLTQIVQAAQRDSDRQQRQQQSGGQQQRQQQQQQQQQYSGQSNNGQAAQQRQQQQQQQSRNDLPMDFDDDIPF